MSTKNITRNKRVPATDHVAITNNSGITHGLTEYADRAERLTGGTLELVTILAAYAEAALGFGVSVKLNGTRITDGFAITADKCNASVITFDLTPEQNATLDTLRESKTADAIVAQVKAGFEAANAKDGDALTMRENVIRQHAVNALYPSLRDAVPVMLAYVLSIRATTLLAHVLSNGVASGASRVELAAYIAELCNEVSVGVRMFKKFDDPRAVTAREVFSVVGITGV